MKIDLSQDGIEKHEKAQRRKEKKKRIMSRKKKMKLSVEAAKDSQ